MSSFLSKHQAKKDKITKNVIQFFKANFPDAGEPVEFETMWPVSKWDYLQTQTMSYNVELNFTTGRVINIQEDK